MWLAGNGRTSLRHRTVCCSRGSEVDDDSCAGRDKFAVQAVCGVYSDYVLFFGLLDYRIL